MTIPPPRTLFNSPLHPDKADRIIEQFQLEPGSRVLDAGCGDGEFLVRVAEHYNIRGSGFDIDSHEIERAQAKASARLQPGVVDFAVQDAKDFSGEHAPYDLIICIGAEFIFGGYAHALKTLKALLAPEGLLLMGTVYWKQEPSLEYLQIMDGENPHFDHATTVRLSTEHGFVPLYICRSSDEEWDDFESIISRVQYLAAIETLSTEAAAAQIEKISRWQNGYLTWGGQTMGFGFYLLRNRAEAIVG